MNKGEIILKFGEGRTSELDTYHSYWLRKALKFRKISDSYTSLIQAIEAYLLTLLSFSQVMAPFEIFNQQKFGIKMPIPNFGVSTTILDPVDRWSKLNFGLLQGNVKLHHFSARVEARRQQFYFLYIFLGIVDWEGHWTTLFDTGLDSLLPFK